jgi:phytoene synthase
MSASLLGGAGNAAIEAAGEGWALVDLARRSSREQDVASAIEAARLRLKPEGRWPTALRPIGMLAILARRDASRGAPFERQGSPLRMVRMLAFRLAGR